MYKLKLMHRGLFAGDFVVTGPNYTCSIGNYIAVEQRGPLVWTGEFIDTPRGPLRTYTWPVLVRESACSEEFEAELMLIQGTSLYIWMDILGDDLVFVRSTELQYKQWAWFRPEKRPPLEARV